MLSTKSPISLEKRKLAAVSYVPMLGPVVFYGHRADKFIQFHAAQGTAVSIYILLAYFIPTFGIYLALLLSALAVSGFIHALHGQHYRIFGLGHFLSFILNK